MTIRPEQTGDIPAISELHALAFGQEAEGRLVDALRDGGFSQLSLVAAVRGELVGHILFSGLSIVTDESRGVDALALAPVAVHPQWQRRGIGSQLIREGLQLCRDGGHQIVIVVGEPAYYARFGFSATLARPLKSPYSGDACMALELHSSALQGVRGEVRYASPFHDL